MVETIKSTNIRRLPAALPDGFIGVDMPRYSMASVHLYGLVQQMKRINSIQSELKGIEQIMLSMSESKDIVFSCHTLIDSCINEYAYHHFKFELDSDSDAVAAIQKIFSTSLVKSREKMKMLAEFTGRAELAQAELMGGVDFLSDVRDVLYHFEAHRYEGKQVLSIISEIVTRADIKASANGVFGPFGFVATLEFANYNHRILMTFLNTLLKPFTHFTPRKDLIELYEHRDLLFLVEAKNFIRPSVLLGRFMKGANASNYPITDTAMFRIDNGYVFLGRRDAENYAEIYTFSSDTFEPLSEAAYQVHSSKCERRFHRLYPPDSRQMPLSDLDELISYLEF